jgi:hypothetical protein
MEPEAGAIHPIKLNDVDPQAWLRKAGERTIPRLRRRLGWFARNVTAREAANYFSTQAMREIHRNLL